MENQHWKEQNEFKLAYKILVKITLIVLKILSLEDKASFPKTFGNFKTIWLLHKLLFFLFLNLQFSFYRQSSKPLTVTEMTPTIQFPFVYFSFTSRNHLSAFYWHLSPFGENSCSVYWSLRFFIIKISLIFLFLSWKQDCDYSSLSSLICISLEGDWRENSLVMFYLAAILILI